MYNNNNLLNNKMQEAINKLVVKEKGILAIDESNATMGKRFEAINLENTENNRRRYRSLVATTKDLNNYISGVILFEETLRQSLSGIAKDQITIAQKFIEQNISVGIKVDQGLMPLYPGHLEKVTKGLDELAVNLSKYQDFGITFAKWRAVISIDDQNNLPSKVAIHINSEQLARYASICQSFGIVPIVEPEVLMDGDHDLANCAKITEKVLIKVFKALRKHSVKLEYILLKPNMILPGKSCKLKFSSEEIAKINLQILKRTVPAAVPSINFLSGGQSEEEATKNLNSINSITLAPWHLSFSFGRALQESCIKAWKGEDANIKNAQRILLNRAKLNSLANLGRG